MQDAALHRTPSFILFENVRLYPTPFWLICQCQFFPYIPPAVYRPGIHGTLAAAFRRFWCAP